MIRTLIIQCVTLGSLLTISACSLQPKPFVAYDDRDYPLSRTAVLSTLGDTGGGVKLVSVDGRKIGEFCGGVACSQLARVKPGSHKFELDFRQGEGGEKLRTLAETAVLEVKDMKARHVYVVHWRWGTDKTVQFYVRDLGEDSGYGLKLGLEGKKYVIEF